jgi:hypothetical protein
MVYVISRGWIIINDQTQKFCASTVSNVLIIITNFYITIMTIFSSKL